MSASYRPQKSKLVSTNELRHTNKKGRLRRRPHIERAVRRRWPTSQEIALLLLYTEFGAGALDKSFKKRHFSAVLTRCKGSQVVALVKTVAYLGLEASPVEVQCQVAPVLPRFAIVGLPDEGGRRLLMRAAEAMRLSARGYTRMLRVAQTIADLSASESVGRIHIAKALSYHRQPPRA